MFKVSTCGKNGVSRQRLLRCVAGICLVSFVAGCMSLENEEGRLPNAMRTAISGLSAKGYPDLTKLPEAPTNVPSPQAWKALEARLVKHGATIAANPAAAALTPEDTNLSWAQSARSQLETAPLAQPAPVPTQGTLTELESAAAARAKFDADLARLPPL